MRAFLCGARPGFDVEGTEKEKRLALTGNNTGNQLIGYGLARVLDCEVRWERTSDASYIRENYDVILIAASNFVARGHDFTYLADLVEQADLPVAMVGLGAQSNSFSAEIELVPGTLRFLKAVSERTHSIGVRGAFTAEILARLGIANVRIVGCPSYYMSGALELPPYPSELPGRPRLVAGASRDVIRHAFDPEAMRHVVAEIMKSLVDFDGVFVCQTETEEIAVAEHLPGADRAKMLLNAMFGASAGQDRFLRWLEDGVRVYWDVEQWIADMKEADFAFGTRFHGVMAALQAGVPGHVLAHDTRTTEMCEFLGIAYTRITDIEQLDIRKLYEATDMEAMRRRYKELAPGYDEFLRNNGLPTLFSRAASSIGSPSS